MGNGCDGYTAAEMAIFVAARVAAVALNSSLTDETVPYQAVNVRLKKSIRERAKKAGTLNFVAKGEMCIRDRVMKLLKDKAQGEFSDLLRDMCIGGFGSIIVWVDEKGNIDYSEYPIQEIIPIYDGRKRLRLLFRRYEVGVWENGSETTKTKVEVYDDRYVTYYTGDSMESLHLDVYKRQLYHWIHP